MNFLENSIRVSDIFAKPVAMGMNGSKKVRTIFGGSLSLLLLMFILRNAYNLYLKYLDRENNPRIFQLSERVPELEPGDNLQMLLPVLKITSSSRNVEQNLISKDSKYFFNLNLYAFTPSNSESSLPNYTQINASLVHCSDESIKAHKKHGYYSLISYERDIKSSWFCIKLDDPQDPRLTTQAVGFPTDYGFFIELGECNQSSCASEGEIDSIAVSLRYKLNYFDLKDMKNPKKELRRTDAPKPLNSKLFRSFVFEHQANELYQNDESGIYKKQQLKDKFYSPVYKEGWNGKRSTDNESSDDDYYIAFKVSHSTEKIKIFRSYETISEFTSEFGGTLSFGFAVFKIIYSLFNQNLYKQIIAEKIFSNEMRNSILNSPLGSKIPIVSHRSSFFQKFWCFKKKIKGGEVRIENEAEITKLKRKTLSRISNSIVINHLDAVNIVQDIIYLKAIISMLIPEKMLPNIAHMHLIRRVSDVAKDHQTFSEDVAESDGLITHPLIEDSIDGGSSFDLKQNEQDSQTKSPPDSETRTAKEPELKEEIRKSDLYRIIRNYMNYNDPNYYPDSRRVSYINRNVSENTSSKDEEIADILYSIYEKK